MKYVVIIGDGMADFPLDELRGKTPLQVADKPSMDMMAQKGFSANVVTVPTGYAPGSDVACMSIFGYDPRSITRGAHPLKPPAWGSRWMTRILPSVATSFIWSRACRRS